MYPKAAYLRIWLALKPLRLERTLEAAPSSTADSLTWVSHLRLRQSCAEGRFLGSRVSKEVIKSLAS